MSKDVLCTPISGLREVKGMVFFQPTYAKLPIPDMRSIADLKGDFSWLEELDDFKEKLEIKSTPWETFKHNKVLHDIVPSVTSSYTDIVEGDEVEEFKLPKDRIIFYRDQQDCVVWSVNPETGKVYEDESDFIVAEDVEEFMLHKVLESLVWRLYAYGEEPGLDQIRSPIMKKYIDFYLNKKLNIT